MNGIMGQEHKHPALRVYLSTLGYKWGHQSHEYSRHAMAAKGCALKYEAHKCSIFVVLVFQTEKAPLLLPLTICIWGMKFLPEVIHTYMHAYIHTVHANMYTNKHTYWYSILFIICMAECTKQELDKWDQ